MTEGFRRIVSEEVALWAAKRLLHLTAMHYSAVERGELNIAARFAEKICKESQPLPDLYRDIPGYKKEQE